MKNIALLFVVLIFSGCSDIDPWGKLDFLLLSPIIVVAFLLREWILGLTKSKQENKTYRSESSETINDERLRKEESELEEENLFERKTQNPEVLSKGPTVVKKEIEIEADLEKEINILSYKVIANILSSCSLTYYDLVGRESQIQDDAGRKEIVRKRSILLASYLEFASSCIVFMPKEMPIELKELFLEIKLMLSDYLTRNTYDNQLDEDLLFELAEDINTVNEETVSNMLPYIEDAVEYARATFYFNPPAINSKDLAYEVCKSFFELDRPAPDNPHFLLLEKDFTYFKEYMVKYMNKGCMDLAKKYS